MAEGCIFCDIANGDKAAEMVYQNERVVAFRDIAPQAPVHILVIPRKHIGSLAGIDNSDIELLGTMILAASDIAEEMGLDRTGFRVVFNTGSDGGQIVDHLHLHLLGGKNLGKLVS